MKNSRFCILVVDDEPALRTPLAQLLTLRGFEVRMAENGADALRQMIEPLPDAIISDLNMPIMCGREFLSIMRRRFPQIPVLVVSGELHIGETQNDIPADAFFTKGNYRIEELCATIKKLESSRPLRPAVSAQNGLSNVRPIDEHGKVLLLCPKCLRPFHIAAAGLDGGLHITQCCFCHASIDFQIDLQRKTKKSQTVQLGPEPLSSP